MSSNRPAPPSASKDGPARRGGRGAGFTLLELLVVTAILGTLLAIGFGGYMALARGADLEGTASRLRSVLMHARNTTIYEGAPARVFIDEFEEFELRDPMELLEGSLLSRRDGLYVLDVQGRKQAVEVPEERLVRREKVKRLRSVGFDTVGMWHFEVSKVSVGYLGRECRLEGGAEVYDWGKIGGAVLVNPPRERKNDRIVALQAPDDAADPFRLRRGGRIELWACALRPAMMDGLLVERKGSYELKVGHDGSVSGGIPGLSLEVEDYAMPCNRWVKFVLEFTPDCVDIFIDDVWRAGADREDGTFDPPEKAELVFGRFFSGVMDEVRVQARVEGEAFDVREAFELRGPAVLVFDGRARLDPAVHTAPVTYELLKDGKSVSVIVEMSGRID